MVVEINKINVQCGNNLSRVVAVINHKKTSTSDHKITVIILQSSFDEKRIYTHILNIYKFFIKIVEWDLK